jgi:hypothetical protein
MSVPRLVALATALAVLSSRRSDSARPASACGGPGASRCSTIPKARAQPGARRWLLSIVESRHLRVTSGDSSVRAKGNSRPECWVASEAVGLSLPWGAVR